MRRIFALSVVLCAATQVYAQGEYCEEFSQGYADGWCEDYPAGACPPAPPSGCMTTQPGTRGAYERGYHQGAEDSDYEVAPEEDGEE